MGLSQSSTESYEDTKEKPVAGKVATLYYFAGRGLADQIRWLLAATELSFAQKVVDNRAKFLKMAERQLPFGQLPLLQIDGLEIVQSQAAVRYIARRANIHGQNPADQLKCEIIAETIRDLIMLVVGVPFHRVRSAEDAEAHIKTIREKWSFVGARFEAVITANGGQFLVGNSLTYVDILLAHTLTWYVEEAGADIVAHMPNLVELQNRVMALPGIRQFIRSADYYPVGDQAYCEQVNEVLGRKV